MNSDKRRGRGFAMAGVVAVLVVLASSGGCEVAVPGGLPSYDCLAGVAGACPVGSVCVPGTHQCVPASNVCSPGSCGPGMVCDDATLACVPEGGSSDASDDGLPGADATSGDAPDGSAPGQPDARTEDGPTSAESGGPGLDAGADAPQACRGLGCKCGGDSDCDTGICADSFILTNAAYQANSGNYACTQPCCSSADCGSGTVCFATGQGGNICLPPGLLGRSTLIGEGIGGATCGANAECRSGLCVNGACADTCCSSAQQSNECASGTICRFATFPGVASFDTHQTPWCGAPIGNLVVGQNCGLNDLNCQSGKCNLSRCAAVCRSSSDCLAGQACTYGLASIMATQDIAPTCGAIPGAPGVDGSSCTSNADCLSDFCDGTRCTDVCFSDVDCTKSGWRCRPFNVKVQFGGSALGSYPLMSCGP